MPHPATPLPFIGTVGNVTIFRLYGQYYVRARTSLTGQRVKKDPAFRMTMQYAALLAKASRLAAQVYAAAPPRYKKHPLYRKLTGEAMTWLKYAWEEKDIVDYLTQLYAGKQPATHWPATQLQWVHRRSATGPAYQAYCTSLANCCIKPMKRTAISDQLPRTTDSRNNNLLPFDTFK